MATIARSVDDLIIFTHTVIVANGSTLPIYGSVEAADRYFGMQLEGQRWAYTDRLRRVQALVESTAAIDRLNFAGDKVDPAQDLQFPRGTDTTVPVDIQIATYENALALLKGINPATERENLNTTVQAYGNLRSYFDRTIVPEHFASGIASPKAWDRLLPYLQSRKELAMRRIS